MPLSGKDGDLVDAYLKELEQVVRDMPRDAIWEVIHVLMAAWRRGSHIFLLGNGGSAATASHMSNDLNKYTIVPGQARFKAMSLADNIPLMTAWGNDTAYENIFVEQMRNFLEPGDVAIGISASGNSANVLKALQFARDQGAVTVGLTGRNGGALRQLVDHCILVPSDRIGQQEDAHMILDHLIASTLRELIEQEASLPQDSGKKERGSEDSIGQ
jgi:D-sedoheptulose 7-phosphate isomerase